MADSVDDMIAALRTATPSTAPDASAAPAPAVDPAAPPTPVDPVQAQIDALRTVTPQGTPVPATKSDPGYIVQEGIKGAASLPMMLASGTMAENQQENQMGSYIASLFGVTTPPPVPATPNATTADLSKAVLGDTYDPASAAGRYGGAVARGVGSALPLATGLGVPGMLGVGLAGPVLGQGASDITKAVGGSDTAANIADFAGNVVGGGGGTAAANALGRTPIAASMFGRLASAPSATDAAVSQLADSGITANPQMVKGLALDAQSANTPIGQYQAPAQALADQLGPTTSPATIGSNLMAKGQTWLDGQQATTKAAFSDFEAQVPKTTPAITTQTQDLLTTPAAGSPTAPPVYGQLMNAMDDAGGNITYDQLKQWRTRVNAATEFDSTQNGGQFNGQLKQLGSALTGDMEATIAGKAGQPGVDAFQAMNKAYGASQDFIDNRIGKLADQNLTPEQVYTNLAQNPTKTATRLNDLVNAKVLDQGDIDMIARQQLNKMGQDSTGTWNPSTFAKSATAMENNSPEAANLLFRSGNAGPAYDNLVANAKLLDTAANSPMAAANKTGGGTIAGLLMKGGKMVAGGVIGSHIPGGEHVGEMAGAMLFGGEHAAPETGNALYRLAQEPWFNRALTKTVSSPSAAAAFLQSQGKMQPNSADDLNTLSSAINQ